MRQWLPKVSQKTRMFRPVRIKSAGVLHGAKRVLHVDSSSSHIVPKDADEDDSSGEEGIEEGAEGGLQHNVKIPKFKMKIG